MDALPNYLDKAYKIPLDAVLQELRTDREHGLESKEAKKRLEHFGPNSIGQGKKVSPLKILFHNIHNIIVYLLIAASIVAFLMGDPVEGFAIIIAILIAVGFGFFSELKAQKSVESLQNMVKTLVKVKRDGKIHEINSNDLVVGDILYIEEGDPLSADGRIFDSKNFASIESALTGESEAIDKEDEALFSEDMPIGDCTNMVFSGTAATRGNSYAVVTATGLETELGKISDMLKDTKKEATPLEAQLNSLGRTLIFFAGLVALLVTLVGLASGEAVYDIIKIGIILAIAAVPEALPAVSTITLALGMKAMAVHNALVKSLPAVETLGSTTVICTDKTGTLTENQMTVKHVYLADKTSYDVEGSGYKPQGRFLLDGTEADPADHAGLSALIKAAVLCSNASLSKEASEYSVIGDPTEGGLIVAGEKAGITRDGLHSAGYKRLGELPFNSKVKYMATAYETSDGQKTLYIKGAPDVLLDKTNASKEQIESLISQNERFAAEGMRVLAIAEITDYTGDGTEKAMHAALNAGVTLLGFVGIIDPPREDVTRAIQESQEAGIRVIMITGDHPKTAQIIAEKIGMNNTETVITGKEMDAMSDQELAERILHTSIFARVSPENKLQIVHALNIDNEVTAMTGDGVNDAPALNGADIGIAMGIRGTEVAKDASDMILTDDKFSTIVEAVKIGRVIFANIEKFVYFLFSCNVVEILVVFLSILFGLPMPILALQILWLNLVVDVFPAMSIAWEAGDDDIMQQPPRDPSKAIVTKSFLLRILLNGGLIGLGSLAVFLYGLSQDYSLATAQTMAFTCMAFGQLFHIFNIRKKGRFGFDASVLENPKLILALITSAVLQLLAVYLPFFNTVMGTVALDPYKWVLIFAGAAAPTVIIQGIRLIFRKTERLSFI